jgi:TPR repeat protein
MKYLLAVLIFILMAAPTYAQGIAEKHFRAATEQGDADFQLYLGMGYLRGTFDSPGGADYDVEGIKWIRKAAKQGHARAQFRLGNEYESGQNIQQDYAEAEKWHRKAAKQGDTDAQERLRKLNAANH